MEVVRRMNMMVSVLLFLVLITKVDLGSCFSLSGFGQSPQEYLPGDTLTVKVDKLTSAVKLSRGYYSLPFCRPHAISDKAGYFDKLLGTGLENSPYVFKLREPPMCRVVCRITFDIRSAKAFREKIHDEYRVNMILDGLSVANFYQLGFDIGFRGSYVGTEDYKYFLYNHLVFNIKYHEDAQTGRAKIVGFGVMPFSIKHEYEGEWNEKAALRTCTEETYYSSIHQEVKDKEEIIFTYDVVFQESNVTWESRWGTYLRRKEDGRHFFAAINSVFTLFFLLGLVAIIMRTHHDISKYNESNMMEETGWKQVHGDVFRHPINSDLLCIYAGTGVQCFGTMTTVLIVYVLGFISPSNRGEIWTAILFLWSLMGLFAGYSSARLHKMFKGSHWKKIALKTALMFPGPVAIVLFVLNSLSYNRKSSSAVPCATMSILVFLWFSISVPLVFVGSYIGFRKPVIAAPVRTYKIPREIPEQSWFKQTIICSLVGGIIPAVVIFYELVLILASIWLHEFYCIRSFQFFTFLALLATSAGTAIVICYFQLCREDYRWWWTSYLTSGFSGLYLFLYAVYLFADHLHITEPVPVLHYFGYMIMGSYAFFVLTGTIGFYACFSFMRLIYSSLKID